LGSSPATLLGGTRHCPGRRSSVASGSVCPGRCSCPLLRSACQPPRPPPIGALRWTHTSLRRGLSTRPVIPVTGSGLTRMTGSLGAGVLRRRRVRSDGRRIGPASRGPGPVATSDTRPRRRAATGSATPDGGGRGWFRTGDRCAPGPAPDRATDGCTPRTRWCGPYLYRRRTARMATSSPKG
jgi:hypothetical protein